MTSFQGIAWWLGPDPGGAAVYDWYVDSINGNDANSGKSAAQALATIAALEAAGISAGDRIGLAKGSSWREQLDIAANNVTIEAYGSGDAPLLDASDVIANSDFTKTDGQTNVYQATVTIAASSANNFVNVWEGAAFLTRAASIAACDSTPGSCYPSAAGGAITLYIHPTGSTNPTTDGKLYEISARRYGLSAFGFSSITLRGIKARRNLYNDGSIVVGRSCRIYDCTAEDGGKHNIYYSDGAYLNNVTARNAYFGGVGGFTLFIGYEDVAPAGLGMTFVNCTATMDTYNAGGGFYDHAAGAANYGVVTYQGCAATNVQTGFTSLKAGQLILNNCQTSQCLVGLQVEVPVVIAGGTFVQNNIAGSDLEKIINLGESSTTLSIDGAAFSGDFANAVVVQCGQNNKSITVQNCSIGASMYPFYLSGTGITLNSDHNTFGNLTTIYRLGDGYTLVSDYNTFGNGSFNLAGTTYTWAQYRAAFPALDANSTHP